MDASKLIALLGEDIQNMEKYLDALKDDVSLLNEKLLNFKSTHSQLEKENDMAREIMKDNNLVIQLKNGQVNVPYTETISFEKFKIQKDAKIHFEGIDQISWNQNENKFEGDFSQPGEFFGKIFFWKNTTDQENGKPRLERQIHILVNADPKSLWKNIPPPAEGPFFKENKSFTCTKLENKTLLGVSTRGKSHAQKGTFRDDDFKICSWENGWVLQVVSDGAGSAEFSREGSKIACESVLKKVSDFILSEKINDLEDIIRNIESEIFVENTLSDEEISSHIETTSTNEEDSLEHQSKQEKIIIENNTDDNNLTKTNENILKKDLLTLVYELTVSPAYFAYNEIKNFAEENNYSIKKFSSTILFAISKEFDFGTVVISFSIGDGAIGIVNKKEGILLMEPDGGEYSGQTRFITMKEVFLSQDIFNRSHFKIFKDEVEAIILMSDGISDPKFGTDNNLKNSDLWLSLWSDLKTILSKGEINEEEVLEWMDFHEKGEYDDRTLTILF